MLFLSVIGEFGRRNASALLFLPSLSFSPFQLVFSSTLASRDFIVERNEHRRHRNARKDEDRSSSLIRFAQRPKYFQRCGRRVIFAPRELEIRENSVRKIHTPGRKNLYFEFVDFPTTSNREGSVSTTNLHKTYSLSRANVSPIDSEIVVERSRIIVPRLVVTRCNPLGRSEKYLSRGEW